jgi:hypothetical protein
MSEPTTNASEMRSEILLDFNLCNSPDRVCQVGGYFFNFLPLFEHLGSALQLTRCLRVLILLDTLRHGGLVPALSEIRRKTFIEIEHFMKTTKQVGFSDVTPNGACSIFILFHF